MALQVVETAAAMNVECLWQLRKDTIVTLKSSNRNKIP